mmetsp:Transcript_88790/g.250099  ORF Transcript_88790/g.250099 Transcript_88790/m.250099 type:complete len:360 (-) Transcript_88790:383-1462(-)
MNHLGAQQDVLYPREEAFLVLKSLQRTPLVQERQQAVAHQLEERDAHGPYVVRRVQLQVAVGVSLGLELLAEEFRGQVPRVAELDYFTLVQEDRAPVICDYHAGHFVRLVFREHEQVFRLQVVVHAVVVVQERHAAHGLLEDARDQISRPASVLLRSTDVAAEVTASRELADNRGPVAALGRRELQDLGAVGVPQRSQLLELGSDGRVVVCVVSFFRNVLLPCAPSPHEACCALDAGTELALNIEVVGEETLGQDVADALRAQAAAIQIQTIHGLVGRGKLTSVQELYLALESGLLSNVAKAGRVRHGPAACGPRGPFLHFPDVADRCLDVRAVPLRGEHSGRDLDDHWAIPILCASSL